MQLEPGQNAELADSRVTVSVNSAADLIALVLSADGQVAGDSDMVFFNQPAAPGVTLSGRSLEVSLTQLRPGADRMVLVASVDAPGQPVGAATVAAGGAQHVFSPAGLTSETAVVLVELYQRSGAWKVRAVGQGYSDGLAGLARDFGVSVDDSPVAVTAAAPARPRITMTKGEEQLPVDMRKQLNLRKEQVAVVLEKHRVLGLQCRVILVLDTSGSTGALYSRGVFARAVERVAAVAAQVDDGAEMQAWAMGSRAERLPDLTIGGLPRWIDSYAKKRYKKAGFANKETAVIADVARYVDQEPLKIPTLVIFFHDGGVHDDRGVESAFRGVDGAPIFWQFVGVGLSNYGVLERLDTLSGRAHDNTGFFALDDLDAVSDADLYDRLLSEFPSWMRGYYPPGHPALAGLR